MIVFGMKGTRNVGPLSRFQSNARAGPKKARADITPR